MLILETEKSHKFQILYFAYIINKEKSNQREKNEFLRSIFLNSSINKNNPLPLCILLVRYIFKTIHF